MSQWNRKVLRRKKPSHHAQPAYGPRPGPITISGTVSSEFMTRMVRNHVRVQR